MSLKIYKYICFTIRKTFKIIFSNYFYFNIKMNSNLAKLPVSEKDTQEINIFLTVIIFYIKYRPHA
jgi:hypothetical protein